MRRTSVFKPWLRCIYGFLSFFVMIMLEMQMSWYLLCLYCLELLLITSNAGFKNIRKMKIDGDEDRLPNNWMELEKTYTYSGGYHSDVYEAITVLQRFLMETRPSMALGLVVIVAFGSCVAGAMVLQWLINLALGYLNN
ncbi:hypothetical protein Hanom_Chr07g00591641 [Helianthus anomalus]